MLLLVVLAAVEGILAAAAHELCVFVAYLALFLADKLLPLGRHFITETPLNYGNLKLDHMSPLCYMNNSIS